jgi:hypothetical protein
MCTEVWARADNKDSRVFSDLFNFLVDTDDEYEGNYLGTQRFDSMEWLRKKIGVFMLDSPPYYFNEKDHSNFYKLLNFLVDTDDKNDDVRTRRQRLDLTEWLQKKIEELESESEFLQKETQKDIEDDEREHERLWASRDEMGEEAIEQREVERQIWDLLTKMHERSQRSMSMCRSYHKITAIDPEKEFAKYHADPRNSQYTFFQLLDLKQRAEESEALCGCRENNDWELEYNDSDPEDSDSDPEALCGCREDNDSESEDKNLFI